MPLLKSFIKTWFYPIEHRLSHVFYVLSRSGAGHCGHYRISTPQIINNQHFFLSSPPHHKQNSFLPPLPHCISHHKDLTNWVNFVSWILGTDIPAMSLLPPEVHTALSQLLRGLTTPDNAVRSQAEDQLNNEWVQNKPDILLMALAEQMGGAEDTSVSSPSHRRVLKQRQNDRLHTSIETSITCTLIMFRSSQLTTRIINTNRHVPSPLSFSEELQQRPARILLLVKLRRSF